MKNRDAINLTLIAAFAVLTIVAVIAYVVLEVRDPNGTAAAAEGRLAAMLIPSLGIIGTMLQQRMSTNAIGEVHQAVNGQNAARDDITGRAARSDGLEIGLNATTREAGLAQVSAAGDKAAADRAAVIKTETR